MLIYLDDVRTPINKDWVVVRNYDEFVDLIKKTNISDIKVISFDHDLGYSAMKEFYFNTSITNSINYDNINEKTGMDCTKFIVDFWIDNDVSTFPEINIHSANPVGTENIKSYFMNYFKTIKINKDITTFVIPFTMMDKYGF